MQFHKLSIAASLSQLYFIMQQTEIIKAVLDVLSHVLFQLSISVTHQKISIWGFLGISTVTKQFLRRNVCQVKKNLTSLLKTFVKINLCFKALLQIMWVHKLSLLAMVLSYLFCLSLPRKVFTTLNPRWVGLHVPCWWHQGVPADVWLSIHLPSGGQCQSTQNMWLLPLFLSYTLCSAL